MKATLRDFFRRYRLSVEQYGEILVAELLNGVKMGDVQPAYDVYTTPERMEQGDCPIRDKIVPENGEVRVEVKSKATITSGGKATVVNVGKVKMGGVRRHPPMTHMLVVLVEPEGEREGNIAEAWLLDLEFVLGHRQGESQYLNVGVLRQAAKMGEKGIWEISEHFRKNLTRPLFWRSPCGNASASANI